MKKIIVTTAVLAVAGLGLTGCGLGGDANADAVETTTTTTQAPTTTTTAAPAQLKTGETSLGKVITDAEGHTLYAFTKDAQFGASTCFDACATSWPAAKVAEVSLAGQGVDSTLIGAIVRKDGTKQLTVNGWPLYTFSGDASASGTVNGQGKGGTWYVVGTNGKLIKTAVPAVPTTVKPSAASSTKTTITAGTKTAANYSGGY